MYSFEPTEEQRMLIDAVHRYAEKDLQPAARDAEEDNALPAALIEKGWELGVLQASIPEAYGGFGEHSTVTGVLAAEEMAWGDLAASLAVTAPAAFVLPILFAGTEEQKETWIPPVIEAEWKPFVAAFIEPDFDFTPMEMRTLVNKGKAGYTLNGVKAYVPYADQAQAFLVFANLEDKTEAFIVPADAKGITVGEREKLLGVQALPLFRLTLKDVLVPLEARIGGEEGADMSRSVASAKVAVAAMAVGMSRAALEYVIPYAKEREVWGTPIAQKQSIAFMLAEMAIEIEAIRMLVWEAAWKLDNDKEDAAKSAYLALTGAADMAMRVTDCAVQALGGHGYIREHPVELWMRNGRGIPVFAGLAMV